MFARPFNRVCRTLLIALAALAISATSASAAVIYGDAVDGERKKSDNGYTNGTAEALLVGRLNQGGSAGQRNAFFVFDLSSITGPIEQATLSLFLQSKLGSFSYSADLYGVGYATAADSWPTSAGHYYEGTLDTTEGVSRLANNFAISTSTTGTYISLSGSDLVNHLNARPDSADFVIFRLSPDAGPSQGTGYMFSSANTSVATQRPKLELTVVPEPAAGVLGLMLLGGLAARRRHD